MLTDFGKKSQISISIRNFRGESDEVEKKDPEKIEAEKQEEK